MGKIRKYNATLNPARYLEASDSLGSVEVNKMADLVILHKNPLNDIKNTTAIDGVITNGQYLNRVELDRLLTDVEEYLLAKRIE
ncbi:amidohydrolase family protein [Mangrovivirga cuniculi]|uniref:Amidohydrolase-related domain-containing protein n=1 Tax=Mangrovivirga cuniculi TaxID=2715131 RepID=A0A4D7JWX1_9BACT|nr:amidohydrolase family protein [Mangrovivirga cuniculi]QCK15295.1 hypothetical protein DCC35_11330 [Mangrovivirga cuniculi]